MTDKNDDILESMRQEFNKFSVKLFGNGTRVGCMDERLERVEAHIRKWDGIIPDLVTRGECKSNHQSGWSKVAKEIGITIAILTLVLRVFEII